MWLQITSCFLDHEVIPRDRCNPVLDHGDPVLAKFDPPMIGLWARLPQSPVRALCLSRAVRLVGLLGGPVCQGRNKYPRKQSDSSSHQSLAYEDTLYSTYLYCPRCFQDNINIAMLRIADVGVLRSTQPPEELNSILRSLR